MKPIPRFLNKPKSFWASVRSLSQHIGYSKKNKLLAPSIEQMRDAFDDLGLDSKALNRRRENLTLADELSEYFLERAEILATYVEPRLMDAKQARQLFEELKTELRPNCPLPLNKQKGEKRAHAYLTGIVNMLIEKHARGEACNYDPHELTTITKNGEPLRTLARRVDGAFPGTINPVAIWELKEYYYTTTFGSRIADGVYESLLDGMELEELREHEGLDIKHYLIVDAYQTWWDMGKPYLCRIFDMLHMGYVDEVLFGREVVDELPRIVEEWVELTKARK